MSTSRAFDTSKEEWLERRRPLRERVEASGDRMRRNVAVALGSATTVQLLEKPLLDPLTRWVEQRRCGLLLHMRLPGWLETTLGILLLDYSLYFWHVLLHRIPLLWRFHVVHHVDLDLDVSTALRFHFGELALSVPWRAAQVLLIGARSPVLRLWQQLTLASVAFHHSNLRLPLWLERCLVRIIVTPRMHGIHHSVVEEETGSNWSSGLTLWDRLHGTLRLDVPQETIVIGVPAYRDPEELSLPRILAMPFRGQRRSWCWQQGGKPQTRHQRGAQRFSRGHASRRGSTSRSGFTGAGRRASASENC